MNQSSGALDPRSQTPAAFFKQAAALGLGPKNAGRLLAQVIGCGEYRARALYRLGILPKRLLENCRDLPRLQLERTVSSPLANFQKLLYRAPDQALLETVLIPLHKPGAVSVCLSSQIGCPIACRVCATGGLAYVRDLETWEIVDQFLQARALVQSQGGRVTGAVFMGMGEPFLNYDRVLAAAELLCFPVRNAISAKAITLSTVGLVPQIRRFTAEDRPFRLSISLGAATDEKRRFLMPIAAQTPVAQVIAAARQYALSRRVRVMLAYVCIAGLNVSAEDARALGALIEDTPVRLSLIDVTDSAGRFRPPAAAELREFRDALRRYVGQPVVRRYSGGAEIGAGCGMLANRSAASA